ncbi:hypothetical protein [Chryseobacterium populi]|uniref:Uncharacterized protein n=1 Tax=Chryseobacterium populi TaxID=1144316 RepID=J3CDL2_9FLAO|nr:hypothetical protein [Chryseobacterium populi]EJL69341.1 hypothetical protein PMI13_03308 [Chryseobacterium populi]
MGKAAEALNVPVEDIKEERVATIVQNNDNLTFSDHASGINYNQYYNIPDYMLENHKEYINLLKEQIESLKQAIRKITCLKNKPSYKNTASMKQYFLWLIVKL